MSDKPSASRARALAAELRDLRRAANLTTKEAAQRIGISPASLNRTELATRMPTIEEVALLLGVYGAGAVARERVLEIARAANPSGWWETGGHALPKQLPTLINFEAQAARIFHYQPLVVPGLLQTHVYMRALLQSGGIPDDDTDSRVAARAGRQTVLTRKRAPRYTAIMDEAVLRRAFGGRKAMAAQIRHILEVAELPNVTVQVIPFDRGGYPIYAPFLLLQFGKARDIVHLEHKQASGFLDLPEDTGPFQPLADTLKAVALGPADTSDFLSGVAAEYDRE
jgi:transcriptional regulator with XRE-family HTH domain